MNKMMIMTDSHSSLSVEEGKKIGVRVIPMPFSVNEESYLEGENISRQDFLEALMKGAEVTTSQPAPTVLYDAFREALQEAEEVLYIPISSALSGSCATAQMIAQEEEFEGKVFVVDNGRVSTPQHRSILDAKELMEEGLSASEIKEVLEKNKNKMGIYIAVDQMEYLKRGGRVSSATALVANVLNIKPVLYFDTGLLSLVKKARGMKKARKEMIEALRADIAKYEGEEVHILIASSAAEKETMDWKAEVAAAFPGEEIMVDDLSMAVSCHIGPNGLGIGYSVKPSR